MEPPGCSRQRFQRHPAGPHLEGYNGSTRIGSGMANINNLGAGRRWEFDAMYMGMDGDRVTDYELYVSP